MSSGLQHKMYNYEVQPPAESWNRIVAALDAEKDPLAERLKNFEATPPAAVWNKIETALDNESKVVPIKRKNVLRYVAAAALLGLMIAGGALLLKNNKESDTALQPDQIHTNSTPNNFNRVLIQEPLDEPPQTSRIQHSADRQIAYGHKPKRISVTNSISRAQQINAPERIEAARKISFDYTVDRYMVYSDGNGNAMRLPKKLYDAISCVQVDVTCKDRIQNIQQKIASAALTSDFTAVLEMLNNLRENQ